MANSVDSDKMPQNHSQHYLITPVFDHSQHYLITPVSDHSQHYLIIPVSDHSQHYLIIPVSDHSQHYLIIPMCPEFFQYISSGPNMGQTDVITVVQGDKRRHFFSFVCV